MLGKMMKRLFGLGLVLGGLGLAGCGSHHAGHVHSNGCCSSSYHRPVYRYRYYPKPVVQSRSCGHATSYHYY